jgi:hypothetical protein
MKALLERRKPLSPRRREWLDDLIAKGEDSFPKVHNSERYEKIVALAEFQLPESKKTMLEFSVKIRNDWKLSEKQESFLEKLVKEAEYIKEHGRWEPTEAQKEMLKSAVLVCESKNSIWLSHQGGLSKALNNVKRWLVGTDCHVDKWSCDKLVGKFQKVFQEIENPKHKQNDFVFHKRSGEIIIIVGNPFISKKGIIVYPSLVNGESKDVRNDDISKRAPK